MVDHDSCQTGAFSVIKYVRKKYYPVLVHDWKTNCCQIRHFTRTWKKKETKTSYILCNYSKHIIFSALEAISRDFIRQAAKTFAIFLFSLHLIRVGGYEPVLVQGKPVSACCTRTVIKLWISFTISRYIFN